MRPASPIPYWRNESFPAPFAKYVLGCSGSVKEELLASFDYYAEIKVLGKELLKKNQHAHPAKALNAFRAYIRQAKTFYETAELLHHRASPLNYYYSFMNLAKAISLLKTPTFVDRNLTHGISSRSRAGGLRMQRVVVTNDGVFKKFYLSTTGKTFAPNSNLRIVDLLSYVSDVRYEYMELGYGHPSSFPAKFAICVDQNKTHAFSVMAIIPFQNKVFSVVEKKILLSFDEVTLRQNELKTIFGISRERESSYRYFEGRQFSVQDPLSKFIAGIHDLISENPFSDEHLFYLNRPIRGPKVSTMNEMHAIYVVMYFLGSLVRYRPDLLENMLLTKDAWLLERFIKSAPLTFLRHARNCLDGNDLLP